MNRAMQVFLTGSVCAGLFVCLTHVSVSAQSRRERRQAQVEGSAKPRNISGGVTFQHAGAFEKTYETIVNHLKRQGQTIDSADKDLGQIITAMEIKGGYSQTGTRTLITLIKDSDTQTSVRVVVTKQKRKKALQVEPWSDPKADPDESAKVAEDLKAALGAAQGR